MSAEEDALAEARRRWFSDAEFHARVHAAAEVVARAYEAERLLEFMPEILPVLREAAAVALVLQESDEWVVEASTPQDMGLL